MGSRSVVLVLVLIVCLAIPALAVIPPGPKGTVNQQLPNEDLSGSGADLSFRDDSIFNISKETGMSQGVPEKGVRTPIAVVMPIYIAGAWSFTLTDIGTKSMTLTLFQSGDAVFGSGQLTSSSSVSQITAGGTVIGDRLALYVIPVGSTNDMYRFSLTMRPGSMGGDYIYSAPGITQPGIAFGSVIAPQVPAVQPAIQQNVQQYSGLRTQNNNT